MANFANDPTISVEPSGSNFLFTVKYTANFTPDDLAFPDGFAESMALFESDKDEPFGGDDDRLLNMPIRTYRPTSSTQTRTFVFELGSKVLDTELGGEELYAQVHFRRNISGIPSMIRNSAVLPLAV
ncbi:hypothetical protein BX286_6144 [Streptomyces sp. 3211.6]|uniref:hypothetical protein n=1 Tax=Streptomyces TaxID=1883 RepID=UPI0009A54ACF|nr:MULTISPECIES: hypothetical protein [Streptomyces]RKT08065.1 hypothetical protein BX286_6144 [Streptomyces sp. 3211.6]RPF44305.1 hypothetical protein EDD96_0828 [Streptomyces sp. Ag109_G2-6]